MLCDSLCCIAAILFSRTNYDDFVSVRENEIVAVLFVKTKRDNAVRENQNGTTQCLKTKRERNLSWTFLFFIFACVRLRAKMRNQSASDGGWLSRGTVGSKCHR